MLVSARRVASRCGCKCVAITSKGQVKDCSIHIETVQGNFLLATNLTAKINSINNIKCECNIELASRWCQVASHRHCCFEEFDHKFPEVWIDVLASNVIEKMDSSCKLVNVNICKTVQNGRSKKACN